MCPFACGEVLISETIRPSRGLQGDASGVGACNCLLAPGKAAAGRSSVAPGDATHVGVQPPAGMAAKPTLTKAPGGSIILAPQALVLLAGPSPPADCTGRASASAAVALAASRQRRRRFARLALFEGDFGEASMPVCRTSSGSSSSLNASSIRSDHRGEEARAPSAWPLCLSLAAQGLRAILGVTISSCTTSSPCGLSSWKESCSEASHSAAI